MQTWIFQSDFLLKKIIQSKLFDTFTKYDDIYCILTCVYILTYTTAVRYVLSLNQNTIHSVSNIKLPPFSNNPYTEMCLCRKRVRKLNCYLIVNTIVKFSTLFRVAHCKAIELRHKADCMGKCLILYGSGTGNIWIQILIFVTQ